MNTELDFKNFIEKIRLVKKYQKKRAALKKIINNKKLPLAD